MTRQEQIAFIREHSFNVIEEICNKAAHGKFPETWNGLELKQFIGDSFSIPKNWLSGKRRKDYNNEVLINNLL